MSLQHIEKENNELSQANKELEDKCQLQESEIKKLDSNLKSKIAANNFLQLRN